MALSPSAIKSDIVSGMQAAGFEFNSVSQLEAFIDVIANTIVDHIQTNAEVTTSVTGTSQSGGAVTGTGTGTIA